MGGARRLVGRVLRERGVGGREEGGVWGEERVIGRNGGERGGVWREGVSQPE